MKTAPVPRLVPEIRPPELEKKKHTNTPRWRRAALRRRVSSYQRKVETSVQWCGTVERQLQPNEQYDENTQWNGEQ